MTFYKWFVSLPFKIKHVFSANYVTRWSIKSCIFINARYNHSKKQHAVWNGAKCWGYSYQPLCIVHIQGTTNNIYLGLNGGFEHRIVFEIFWNKNQSSITITRTLWKYKDHFFQSLRIYIIHKSCVVTVM